MNDNTKQPTKDEWIRLAMEVLETGVSLMSHDQIREWSGIRLALELGVELQEEERGVK